MGAICQNCAYAVKRSELKKFAFLEYECTNDDTVKNSRIPYRYANSTCNNFLPTTNAGTS